MPNLRSRAWLPVVPYTTQSNAPYSIAGAVIIWQKPRRAGLESVTLHRFVCLVELEFQRGHMLRSRPHRLSLCALLCLYLAKIRHPGRPRRRILTRMNLG